MDEARLSEIETRHAKDEYDCCSSDTCAYTLYDGMSSAVGYPCDATLLLAEVRRLRGILDSRDAEIHALTQWED